MELKRPGSELSPLECIVWKNLRGVSAGLIIYYLVIGALHGFILTEPWRAIMISLAFGSVLALALIRRHLRLMPTDVWVVHVWAAIVAGIVLLNSAFHLYFSKLPSETANFAMLAIGAGSLMTSRRTLALVIAATVIVWTVIAAPMLGQSREWDHYGFVLFASGVLGILIHSSRVRAFQDLELSGRRYRGIVEAINEGVVLLNDGKISDVNPATERIFGRTEKELIEKPVELLFAEGGFPRESSRSVQVLGKRKAGEGFPMEVCVNPIEGFPDFRVLAVRDLSEKESYRKTIEEQRSVVESTAKLSTLGEMAGGVAHEVNNPLTAIIHRVELLGLMAKQGKEPLRPEVVTKFVEQILREGMRIKKIINGLRIIARESSNDPFEWVKVAEIVDDSVALCIDRFRKNRVRLVMDPIRPDLALECHPSQLGQIVLNLLSNAADAVESLPDRWVRISLEEVAPNGIRLVISDSGNGIPPELREKIMQPFFTTKGSKRGTGLGLSISRSLAEAHGGRLYLDPDSLRTRFVLELPVRQCHRAPKLRSEAAESLAPRAPGQSV